MNDDTEKTTPKSAEFDFSAFPPNTAFHERRNGFDRRFGKRRPREDEPLNDAAPAPVARERRARKERRRRVDPITFEKQYSEAELEFMNAMQRYKERTGTLFPSYGEVLKVAVSLGYRRILIDEDDDPCLTD